jgi:CRP/FNR family transcriptional regulator
MTKEQVLVSFPAIQRWRPEARREFLAWAQLVEVAEGTLIQHEGQSCTGLGLMVSGAKRVYKLSESGREITLYESGPGEVCMLNASCVLSNTKYPAMAVAGTDCEMLVVRADKIRMMVDEFEEIRAFVHSILSESIALLLELIVEVTFNKMDQRLIEYLVEKSEDGVLAATHQKIAFDLGTAREVVSRLLKDFEQKGMVSLSRNCIRLEDPSLSGPAHQ